jgi:hypothetical protein
MKIYNYTFLHPHNNATICITVRTEEGEAVADSIAHDELAIALNSRQVDWYVEDVEEENY